MKGFKSLPLQLTEDGSVLHHMYYKKHVQRSSVTNEDEDEDATDRTLFVVNIPFNFDFNDVSQILSCFGDVECVLFHTPSSKEALPPGVLSSKRPKTGSGQQARVIFSQDEAVTQAVNSNIDTPQPYHEGSHLVGMQKWINRYNSIRPETETLQFQVDKFMEAFDRRTKAEKESTKAAPAVDEDGWTVVRSNPKKKRKLPSLHAEETKVMSKKRKKEKGKVLHFYKHQQRQEKQEQLAALRKKFEEDKQQLAKMRANRKFSPF
mmetsp:Transcript_46897/g.92310  ORF Transcript_46897/g.92310 Transcript_46897/m.92310 type:complete len:263 (+) Transcript_46897:19-807(+)